MLSTEAMERIGRWCEELSHNEADPVLLIGMKKDELGRKKLTLYRSSAAIQTTDVFVLLDEAAAQLARQEGILK